MPPDEQSARSGFWAFWSSLGGVLTGIAAVLGAVVALATLFLGGNGTEVGGVGTAPDAPAAPEPGAAPSDVTEGCFARYFRGIPGYRLGTLEAGAYVDVLSETEPKAGRIGIVLTDFGRVVGGIRFAFFPENAFFKIESFVDARCRPVEAYENREGGDKHSWPDSSPVRVRFGDRFYDLTANGRGSIVRVGLTAVAP